MVGKSKGKIDRVSPDSRTMRLTIPAELAADTTFPFKDGEKLIIEIKGDELRVKKENKK